MNKTENEEIQSLLVAALIESATNRETFSQPALQEMADSILEKGVIQPITVRPVACIENEVTRAAALKAGAKFEIVAGERRWRSSKLAKKIYIPAIVRELSDLDALKVQVIENAQRENPQPLEEAAQYDRLLKSGTATVKEMAAQVGKSPTFVYQRISLLRLPDKMKAALRADKVSLPVAFLVARIPNPIAATEAANRILKGDAYGHPFSLHEAQQFIFEQCMMQLKGAPFDTKDAKLVPDAGACALCPKRTGNEKELFADVGRADVCTDVGCFQSKCKAARDRLLAKAKEEGKTVLSPEESAQLYPHHSNLSYDAPYIELKQPCPFAQRKTWADVIAKLPETERPTIAVAVDKNGTLHELIGRKEAGEAVRTLDLAKPAETRGSLSPTAVQQRKDLRESREKHERTNRAVDLAITALIERQAKAKDTKALSRLLLMLALKAVNFDTERRVAKRYGFTTPKNDGEPRTFYRAKAKAAAADPLPFALESLLWHSSLYTNYGLPEAIVEACKIYGIDLKKIEAAAKEKPAKIEPEANPTLPVNRLKKKTGKALVTTK